MENNGSRVLIVDDMPINRMIISSLLATNGVRSDQVESGAECLEMCRQKKYDLILLDHRMPDLDGVDTLILLKELFAEQGREVPVICHTAEEGRQNINLYKAAGFADVLIKPIDPRLLSEVLMTYLPEEDILSKKDETPLLSEESPESDMPADSDTRDELDKLPVWLKTVPHIDLVAGIANCGSAEDYVDSLFIFHSSIQDKSYEIEHYLVEEDWTTYGLRVHSLKSMARLVGARNLGEYAANLERAAKCGDHAYIRSETPALLASYRFFIDRLAPLMDDEKIRQLMSESTTSDNPIPVVEIPKDLSRNILFVKSAQGIVPKGIEMNLKDAGFKVISIPDEPDMIISHRYDADIVLYMPSINDESHIGLSVNLLGEICQDDSKILCLTGDVPDIERAMASSGAYRVSRTYPRPIDIHAFLEDMEYFSEILSDYHRQKSLFVVDDDPDYLSVIEHWLSDTYTVSCFNSGDAVLSGLSVATPDLLLLDYEMPEMDGYDLMMKIRTKPDINNIPIIFLTGKNDRDHVFKILEYKPDGYLLKSSQKEYLLDALERFFSESLYRKSL